MDPQYLNSCGKRSNKNTTNIETQHLLLGSMLCDDQYNVHSTANRGQIVRIKNFFAGFSTCINFIVNHQSGGGTPETDQKNLKNAANLIFAAFTKNKLRQIKE